MISVLIEAEREGGNPIVASGKTNLKAKHKFKKNLNIVLNHTPCVIMNETFKDTLCHIACLHSGDKWESEKNCWGENMAYTLPTK